MLWPMLCAADKQNSFKNATNFLTFCLCRFCTSLNFLFEEGLCELVFGSRLSEAEKLNNDFLNFSQNNASLLPCPSNLSDIVPQILSDNISGFLLKKLAINCSKEFFVSCYLPSIIVIFNTPICFLNCFEDNFFLVNFDNSWEISNHTFFKAFIELFIIRLN